VHRILGLSFSAEEIQRRLERVGVEVTPQSGSLKCRPPSWRLDLVQEADYIEEILRLDGYEGLPETLPFGPVTVVHPLPLLRQNAALRETLIQHGFSELRNLAFVSGAEMAGLGYSEEDAERARLVALQNPLGEEMAFMRSSLVPAVLRCAAYNLRYGVQEIRQFELAKTYFSKGAGNLPEERRALAGILIPNEDPHFWGASDALTPFFQAKGVLLAALARERLSGAVEPAEAPAPYFHPAATGVIKVGDSEVGFLGRIHPALARRAELPEISVLFQLDLDALLAISGQDPNYAEAPRYQAVVRDFAILVDVGLTAGQVEAEIWRLASKQLEELECFDQYVGVGVPDGRKSLAFRLTLRAKDRTLKESEVSKTVDRVLAGLETALGAQRR
jgi:phenylalanyl-tRNA synthetase beta chain